MKLARSWSVGKTATCCAHTGEAFNLGDTIVSALFKNTDKLSVRRHDFGLQAWQLNPQLAASALSHWQTQYRAKRALKSANEKQSNPTEQSQIKILQELIEEDDAKSLVPRYLLALMLEHQKLFKEVDHYLVDQAKYIVFEDLTSGAISLIAEPQLSLQELKQSQQEITESMLRHGISIKN